MAQRWRFYIFLSVLALGAVQPLTAAPDSTLTVNFTGMTPHVGQRLELRVVDKGSGAETARTRVTVPAPDFAVTVAGLEPLHSYWIDFYADFNGNGLYDPPPIDHAWRLEANGVSGDTTLDFAHNTNFTEILWPYLLSVHFTGMSLHVGELLELRLVDQLTRTEAGRVRLAGIPGPDFSIRLPGLHLGRQYALGFYADHNGNGLYDPPPADFAWALNFTDTAGDTMLDFAPDTHFTDLQWPYRLTLNLTGLAAHVGQLFELRVVEEATGREAGRTRLEAVPTGSFSAYVVGISPGVAYRADFFVDANGDGIYSPPPADQSWRIAFTDTTGDVELNFADSVDFTDIQWPPPTYLFFPRLSYLQNVQTDGYGFVNTTDADVLVRFHAFNSAGVLTAASPDFNWPASSQSAYQAESIFGLTRDTEAWVVAESSRNSLRGFFLTQLFATGQLAGLDGAEVFTAPLTDGILARVKTSGAYSTELFLANPGGETVSVTLTGYDGATSIDAGTRDIQAMGYRTADLATALGPDFDGYLRVQSTGGIIGNAILRDGTASIASLNLLPVSAAATTCYAPHVVLFPGAYYTEVNLVNPGGVPVTATLTAYDASGSPVGTPVEVEIPANQIRILRDEQLGLPGGVSSEGWLRIDSVGGPVLGCLTFGNPVDNHYMSTLPLQTQPAGRLYFAQVANGTVGGVSFFTGIAVVNPGDSPALVTIEVHGSDGALLGTATRPLAPHEKYVRLIHQIEGIGTLPDQSSGYMVVDADRPVFSFVLFGDEPLNFLSAVPAQQ